MEIRKYVWAIYFKKVGVSKAQEETHMANTCPCNVDIPMYFFFFFIITNVIQDKKFDLEVVRKKKGKDNKCTFWACWYCKKGIINVAVKSVTLLCFCFYLYTLLLCSFLNICHPFFVCHFPHCLASKFSLRFELASFLILN